MGILGFGWQQEALKQRFYSPAFRGMYDRFLDTIREYARPTDIVLDAGCGSGRVFRHRLAGRAQTGARPGVRRVVGVDVTDEPRANPNIDDAAKGDLRALPLRDGAFDLVVMSHVAEHLSEPEAAFRELARVLRPSGRLLLLTPNRWHYVPLAARLLPHRLHLAFSRSRGVEEEDIFPTAYRANTAGQLRALAEGAGLAVERLERFETEPEYLAFHLVPYALGVAYERLVNRLAALAPLRVNLLLVGRRERTHP